MNLTSREFDSMRPIVIEQKCPIMIERALSTLCRNYVKTSRGCRRYDELEELIERLNTCGGKIYFNNGNYNIISAGINYVSLIGDIVHIVPHDGYKETFSHISGIAEVLIY